MMERVGSHLRWTSYGASSSAWWLRLGSRVFGLSISHTFISIDRLVGGTLPDGCDMLGRTRLHPSMRRRGTAAGIRPALTGAMGLDDEVGPPVAQQTSANSTCGTHRARCRPDTAAGNAPQLQSIATHVRKQHAKTRACALDIGQAEPQVRTLWDRVDRRVDKC